MRCLHLFMFIILLLHLNYVCNNPQSPSFPPPIMCVPKVDLSQNYDIKIDSWVMFQIIFFGSGVITILSLIFSHICNDVRYVTFDTNLNISCKRILSFSSSQLKRSFLSIFLLGLLLIEYSENLLPVLISIYPIPKYGSIVVLSIKTRKLLPRMIFSVLCTSMFYMAISPATCMLCLMVFQIWCHLYTKNEPHWLPIILIILSNDVHLNPGPQFQNNFFNFMSWNVNSLAKDNFQRVSLIEAHNSLFNYDLISICETSLNDSVTLPDTMLNDYTFEPANHPANTRRGGVGLFFKNSLPVVIRKDLSFDESIVIELKFGRKKVFFTVLYRSPSFDHSSPEFQTFLLNFRNLYSKIKAENPFATYFTGDFNAHSQFWLP